MAEIEKYEEKEQFLDKMEQLRPDLFYPESWNDEQKAKATEMVRPGKMRTAMYASIPLRCQGPKCIFADVCPLLAENLAPVGLPCPIELSAVQQFMTEFKEELGVDDDNLIEVSMVRDLVDQEIQYQRKVWILSKEHFIQDNVVGISSDGEPIMQKQLHLAVELEDRLHKRKKDLRNQLLATRESRAKVGQGTLDTAQVVSKLMDDVRQIQAAKQKALNAKLGIVERDEYIQDAEIVDVDPPDKED